MVHKQSQSFVFSKSLRTAIADKKEATPIITRTLNVIDRLSFFGAIELVVNTTKDTSILDSVEMNLYFFGEAESGFLNGMIMLRTNNPCRVKAHAFPIVKKAIDSMNIVIKEIIPGVQLELYDYGEEIGPEGIHFNMVG